jgi:GrpB-like predicted nucleotidyltransferase (UPF0157 family)
METGSPSNPSSPNLEQLMQLGIQTARKGNKPNARMIFQQVLDADKQNERAWLWMAAVSETPEDRFRYLRTVLRINPNNQTALRELKKMQQRRESSNTQALRIGLIGLIIIVVLIAIGIVVAVLVA